MKKELELRVDEFDKICKTLKQTCHLQMDEKTNVKVEDVENKLLEFGLSSDKIRQLREINLFSVYFKDDNSTYINWSLLRKIRSEFNGIIRLKLEYEGKDEEGVLNL